MTKTLCRAGRFQRVLCWTLAISIAIAPSVSALAQTNAAAMSVLQRAQGTSPEGPASSPPGVPGPAAGPSVPGAESAGKLDTRYVAPRASVIVVVRPAQLLASPIAQVFPIEAASAAGTKYLGFDAAEMDEIVAFGDMSNPTAPNYGATFKFKNPIRATSIPVERRAHAQLAELGGKKYLRSAVPMLYSLYGPNNKTLIAATDAALHQFVESTSQPKTGPLIDRIREATAGNDLYIAVDVAALRPFIQMGLAQAQSRVPAQFKPYLEMVNLISAVELTVNVSAPGPSSLVVHCNDDAAAQQVETAIQEGLQKARAVQQSEQPGGDDVIAQAMARYSERMLQPFSPQRSGTSITCFHIDGQNPGQQQMMKVAFTGLVVALMMPAVQAARNTAMRKAAAQGVPPGAPGGPAVAPESGPQPPPQQ